MTQLEVVEIFERFPVERESKIQIISLFTLQLVTTNQDIHEIRIFVLNILP